MLSPKLCFHLFYAVAWPETILANWLTRRNLTSLLHTVVSSDWLEDPVAHFDSETTAAHVNLLLDIN